MCDICRNKSELQIKNNENRNDIENYSLQIYDNRLNINYYKYYRDYTCSNGKECSHDLYIKIKYCPFCGEKLTEQN